MKVKNLYKLIFTLNIQQFLAAKFISNIDNTNLQMDISPIKLNYKYASGCIFKSNINERKFRRV